MDVSARTLHLVRARADRTRVPDELVDARDRVLCVDEEPVEALLDQIFAHPRVIVW